MVRSKSHIKYEVDQKIRLEKERVKLQMQLIQYEARLQKEILELQHRHFMEGWMPTRRSCRWSRRS